MFEKSQWRHFCINLHADITTNDTPKEFVIELDNLHLKLDRINASPAVNRYYLENKKVWSIES